MNLSIIIKIKYYDKHLDDCIRSIVSQNFKQYEVIFVSQKNNTQIDVFLLNILNKYSSSNNFFIVQEENKDFNEILNIAIKQAKGRYIHIIDQNTLLLDNTYYEFFKLQEEFNYDLIIYDYIKILDDISLSEVYKKYNNMKSKFKEKNKHKNRGYIIDLKESGLIFDFSSYSKDNSNNLYLKTKGFEYFTSNIYESIQRLDINYKNKILSEIDIQGFNVILKKEFWVKNLYIFSSLIDTKMDIYKFLPMIKNITCVKDTAICQYKEKEDIKYIKQDKDIDQLTNIITQSKLKLKQILEIYKRSPKNYTESYDLIEYFIISEVLNFDLLKHNLSELDSQRYTKAIFEFLEKLAPNYLNNKYFKPNGLNKIKTNKKHNNLKKYINKNLLIEAKEVPEGKIKKEVKQAKKEIKQNKQRKKEGKEEKDRKETKKGKSGQTKKRNIFKVFLRKLSFDINKIKRTRINSDIKKSFVKAFNNIYNFFKKIFNKIKGVFTKIFKREKKKDLLISSPVILLLSAPESIDIEEEVENIEEAKKERKTHKKTNKEKIVAKGKIDE